MRLFIIIIIAIISLNSCSSNNSEKKNTINKKNETSVNDKQLNITILLDLSDRIDPSKSQNGINAFNNDIKITDYFTELFKQDMEKRGAYMAKGKLNVMFSPRFQNNEINEIASKLKVDLSDKDINDKKIVFDSISFIFKKNLTKIYTKYIEDNNYPGSDIWGFFKNDINDFCIEDNYRNILVIITDGYIFHEDSRIRDKNRTSFLSQGEMSRNGLRTKNWKNKMTKGDYGFITANQNLENIEILVLEINPSKNHKEDEGVIKAYLAKWFNEMNVKKFKLINSDLPSYTLKRIEKFIKL